MRVATEEITREKVFLFCIKPRQQTRPNCGALFPLCDTQIHCGEDVARFAMQRRKSPIAEQPLESFPKLGHDLSAPHMRSMSAGGGHSSACRRVPERQKQSCEGRGDD
jgi:hypothetical protein